MNAEIKEIEKDLVNIDMQMGLLARALNRKTGPDPDAPPVAQSATDAPQVESGM
jgi:hypothetical protein